MGRVAGPRFIPHDSHVHRASQRLLLTTSRTRRLMSCSFTETEAAMSPATVCATTTFGSMRFMEAYSFSKSEAKASSFTWDGIGSDAQALLTGPLLACG